MNFRFISSIAFMDTYSGGLVNSAIRRIKDISETEIYSESDFLITYINPFTKSAVIESFYRERYKLKESVKFINFYDLLEGIYYEKNQYWFNDINYSIFEIIETSFFSAISVDKTNVIFSESPLKNDFRTKIKMNNVYNLFFVHSTHSKIIDSKIPWYSRPYKAAAYSIPLRSKNTGVVFFNPIQLEEVKNIEGEKSNYFLCPHYSATIVAQQVERKRKVVYVGRIDLDGKKIELMLNSFSRVNLNIDFEIYGDCQNPIEKEEFKELLNKYNAISKGNIKYCGYTNNPSEVFASAELSICLSKFEGFGLSILESLTQGTPVLSSNVSYGPKYLLSDGSGILSEDDSEKIAFEIEQYFLNKKFDQMSKKAVIKANEFKKGNVIERFLEIIQKTIEFSPLVRKEYLYNLESSMRNKYFTFKLTSNISDGFFSIRYFLEKDDVPKKISSQIIGGSAVIKINIHLLENHCFDFIISEFGFSKRILCTDKSIKTQRLIGFIDNNRSENLMFNKLKKKSHFSLLRNMIKKN